MLHYDNDSTCMFYMCRHGRDCRASGLLNTRTRVRTGTLETCPPKILKFYTGVMKSFIQKNRHPWRLPSLLCALDVSGMIRGWDKNKFCGRFFRGQLLLVRTMSCYFKVVTTYIQINEIMLCIFILKVK